MNHLDHNAEGEELMAYIDGELSREDSARVERHLAACAACSTLAAELGAQTAQLAAWTVGTAPRIRLRSEAEVRRSVLPWLRWPRLSWHVALTAVAGVVLAVVIGAGMLERRAAPDPAAAQVAGRYIGESVADGGRPSMAAAAVEAPAEQVRERLVLGGAEQSVESKGPLVIRTARLVLIPSDFDAARGEVERIVAAAGGFTGRIAVTGARGGRTLSASLRIPGPTLADTLTALRRLGTVTDEGQEAEDVTRQSVDLDARLSNARASERRLKEILERRTGTLADVLAVEREIGRVRGEIERMEAERKSLDGRVAYANVIVQLSEERKAAVDLGPQSLGMRFRNAFVDGWAAVLSGAVELGLLVTRLLPLFLVLLFAAAPLLFAYRRRRGRRDGAVSAG